MYDRQLSRLGVQKVQIDEKSRAAEPGQRVKEPVRRKNVLTSRRAGRKRFPWRIKELRLFEYLDKEGVAPER
jgi:hypothetical protein